MTTGFVTEYGGGASDLDGLFHPGSTGQNTGFVSGYRGLDLGACFDPLDAGGRLPFNTGFVALNGLDLSDCFCALGTRVPDWPIGGGFLLQQIGQPRFVTDTVTALSNRMAWSFLSTGADNPFGGNLIADRFIPCPGTGSPNASVLQDIGSYVRGVTRRLPLGSQLRFEYGTINLPGYLTVTHTIAPGGFTSGWQAVHSGPIAFCSNVDPFVDDPMNVNGFSPSAGFFFGAMAVHMNITGSKDWSLTLAAGFSVENSQALLNEHRIYVTRIS